MRSPEKVLVMLERIQQYSDQEIAEAVPVPIAPPMLRVALAAVTAQVPDDAKQLDQMLTRLGEFCLSLRSDTNHEPVPA